MYSQWTLKDSVLISNGTIAQISVNDMRREIKYCTYLSQTTARDLQKSGHLTAKVDSRRVVLWTRTDFGKPNNIMKKISVEIGEPSPTE